MKEKIMFCLSSVWLFFSLQVNAQEEVHHVVAETLQEKIILFTDRTLYATNEQINFSAKYIFSPELPPGKNWSTVLYLELIKPDGTALVQNKYPLSHSVTSGYIHIPKDIRTGVYYLKAYTKWMRNYPTSSYGYSQIKLINPYDPRISEVPQEKQESFFSYETVQENKDIILSTDRNTYGKREKVNVSFDNNLKHNQAESYVVSVVRKGSKYNTILVPPTENIRPEKNTVLIEQSTILFYPELNGISLSGKVLNTFGVPIQNADGKLSHLTGNGESFLSNFTTNDKGEFLSSLPLTVIKEDFLIDAKNDSLNLKIELGREFSDKPIILKAMPLELGMTAPSVSIETEQNTELFYPEIDGISLSGKVFNTDSKAIENANVNLSLLYNQSHVSSYTTNSRGAFYFSFPTSVATKHDFFIDAIKDSLNLNIELDKEFCSKPLFLKTIPFELSSEEKKLANEICINAQLSEVYKDTNTLGSTNPENNPENSFYGTPEDIFYTKDYIELPYLEEFIFEIVLEVRISRSKESRSIISDYKHSFAIFPFLVLVDNIPMTNLLDIAKIRTDMVEKLDLIYSGYVLGNNKYSGIMNIFTKNKDLSGIELPQSSMFFNYQMFAEQEKTNNLTSLSSNGSSSRMPDIRNYLYWNPDYQPAENAENQFSFYTSDTNGEYQVIVQAIAKDGSVLITTETNFMVE